MVEPALDQQSVGERVASEERILAFSREAFEMALDLFDYFDTGVKEDGTDLIPEKILRIIKQT